MRFLADESCDFAVVRALRARGHDVVAICEVAPRADDSHVIRLAVGERRVLLTEDKDFGQLVFAHGERTQGVILLRFPAAARELVARDVTHLVDEVGDRLHSSFVVVQPGKLRITHPPSN
ncbi:DUF5615 family PIN-like protein [bacterium]|nr:DUF5615 family PIN-like protein [bacterium]